jgi:hypothetical protein
VTTPQHRLLDEGAGVDPLNPGLQRLRLLPALLGAALLGLAGCGESAPTPLEGSPAGPYRLTLMLGPAAPQPGTDTLLNFELTQRASGAPVHDLQIVHERALHTFIVARDFSSFAHLHHEDFGPIDAADRDAGRQRFAYRFPATGDYRIVSEFTHRDRSWSQRFDVRVGHGAAPAAPPVDLKRMRRIGDYAARLEVSPAQPVAGHEAELVLALHRDGQPVTNLALWLGAEAHVAVWRSDGEQFGHAHSYTPEMARMMAAMQGHRVDAAHSAAMMLKMMSAPPRLVYPGPVIPVRHVFPTSGLYHVFIQCAPGGQSLVVPFTLEVLPDDGKADTTLRSIVDAAVR